MGFRSIHQRRERVKDCDGREEWSGEVGAVERRTRSWKIILGGAFKVGKECNG